MIRVIPKTDAALKHLIRVQAALGSGAFDQPVEIASLKTVTSLVRNTPKRYTGLTRKSWKVTKPRPGARLISNSSKVMLFLEEGTGNAGTPTSRGGYIYPKNKKFLYVPLNARASIGGWDPSLMFGKDYVLARRVRGIKAMKIVETERPRAKQRLRREVKIFLESIIK